MFKSAASKIVIVAAVLGTLIWSVELAGKGITGVQGGSGLKAGKILFAQNCARCHSLDPAKPQSVGPFLGDLHTRAGNNQLGLTGVEYVANSIVAPSDFIVPGYTNTMPQLASHMTEDGVKAIVSFLLKGTASQSALNNIKLPAKDDSAAMSSLQTSRNEIEKGKTLFFGKGQCAKCHMTHSGMEYGINGPALSWRGLIDPKYVAESIIAPSTQVAEKYGIVSCLLITGEAVAGQVAAKDDDGMELVVQSNDGKLHNKRVLWNDIDDEATNPKELVTRSPMPENYGTILTGEEIQSLVAFISALNNK